MTIHQPIPSPPIDPTAYAVLIAVRRVLCAALPVVRHVNEDLWRDLNRALRSTERALVGQRREDTP